MKTTPTKAQIKEMQTIVKKSAKNIIVFDKITFVEYKEYERSEDSKYFVFGLFNKKIDKTQSATISKLKDGYLIEFRTHPQFTRS